MKDYLVKLRNKLFGVNAVLAALDELKQEYSNFPHEIETNNNIQLKSKMNKTKSSDNLISSGHLDGIFQNSVTGWAWNPLKPNEAVYVDIYINGELSTTVKAEQFRQDLLEGKIGNGIHGFSYSLEDRNVDSVYLISVRLAGTELEILNSPMWVDYSQKNLSNFTTLKLDPHNIDYALENLDGAKFEHFLIDINDTCNADCVYCPNLRSKKRIELEQFKNLLTKCLEINTFQFGCGQEPTLDVRLPDFYKALHNSELRPKRLVMITNASLLHRYDVSLFQECGLNELQISLDTADPEINALTRCGTDLSIIVKNLKDFRQKCPEVKVAFSVVVHAMTIDGIEALLDLGESLAVSRYYFREIFNHKQSHVSSRNDDYLDWIKKISLSQGEFQKMQERLSQHPALKKIIFIPANRLDSTFQDMVNNAAVIQN